MPLGVSVGFNVGRSASHADCRYGPDKRAMTSSVNRIIGRVVAKPATMIAIALARSSCCPAGASIVPLPRLFLRSSAQIWLISLGTSGSLSAPLFNGASASAYKSDFGRADCSTSTPTRRNASTGHVLAHLSLMTLRQPYD